MRRPRGARVHHHAGRGAPDRRDGAVRREVRRRRSGWSRSATTPASCAAAPTWPAPASSAWSRSCTRRRSAPAYAGSRRWSAWTRSASWPASTCWCPGWPSCTGSRPEEVGDRVEQTVAQLRDAEKELEKLRAQLVLANVGRARRRGARRRRRRAGRRSRRPRARPATTCARWPRRSAAGSADRPAVVAVASRAGGKASLVVGGQRGRASERGLARGRAGQGRAVRPRRRQRRPGPGRRRAGRPGAGAARRGRAALVGGPRLVTVTSRGPRSEGRIVTRRARRGARGPARRRCRDGPGRGRDLRSGRHPGHPAGHPAP